MSAFIRLLLLAGGTVLAHLLLLASSPGPLTRSGNGIHPVAALAALLSAGLMIATLAGLYRYISAAAVRWPFRIRVVAGVVSALAAAAFAAWGVSSFRAWQELLILPTGGLVNQYTLGFWGGAWQFWLALAALTVALAVLRSVVPTLFVMAGLGLVFVLLEPAAPGRSGTLQIPLQRLSGTVTSAWLPDYGAESPHTLTVFIVRTESGEFLAFSGKDPSSGCMINWDPAVGRFVDPCDKTRYQTTGARENGGGGLLQFPARVEESSLQVEVTQAPRP